MPGRGALIWVGAEPDADGTERGRCNPAHKAGFQDTLSRENISFPDELSRCSPVPSHPRQGLRPTQITAPHPGTFLPSHRIRRPHDARFSSSPLPPKNGPTRNRFFSSYNTFFNSISTGLFSRIHASAISPWICFMHTFPQCVA